MHWKSNIHITNKCLISWSNCIFGLEQYNQYNWRSLWYNWLLCNNHDHTKWYCMLPTIKQIFGIAILWYWVYIINIRRVWRYQRCNQNPYIEEEQTIQWPNEKVQKDKQRYTKHTHKTKDRVTRSPLKTGNLSLVHYIGYLRS
jgi:hypothetical protein